MRKQWLKVVIAAGLVLASAAAFAAYLGPGMVIEFANVVLCS